MRFQQYVQNVTGKIQQLPTSTQNYRSMDSFPFNPYPTFATARLRIRQLTNKDDRDVFKFRSNVEVGRYLSRPLEETVSGCRDFIENINEGISRQEWYYWGLALPENRVVGTICLWNISPKDRIAEIGYELHPDFQRQGLMQEAMEAILHFGFQDMALDQIEACLQNGNQASIRLLERNGFTFVKKLGDEEKFAGEEDLQLVAYHLRREEWQKR